MCIERDDYSLIPQGKIYRLLAYLSPKAADAYCIKLQQSLRIQLQSVGSIDEKLRLLALTRPEIPRIDDFPEDLRESLPICDIDLQEPLPRHMIHSINEILLEESKPLLHEIADLLKETPNVQSAKSWVKSLTFVFFHVTENRLIEHLKKEAPSLVETLHQCRNEELCNAFPTIKAALHQRQFNLVFKTLNRYRAIKKEFETQNWLVAQFSAELSTELRTTFEQCLLELLTVSK